MRQGRWLSMVILSGALLAEGGCATKPPVIVDPMLTTARQALVKNPGDLRPQLALAELYFQRHDYLRATQYLSLVEGQSARYRSEGIDAERVFQLGVLIAVHGQHYSQAIRRCQARLEQVMEDSRTRSLLASLLEAIGDELAAERQWRLMVALQPKEPGHLLSLARFYLRTERIDRNQLAQRLYSRYLELEPEGPEAARVKAALRIQQLDETLASE